MKKLIGVLFTAGLLALTVPVNAQSTCGPGGVNNIAPVPFTQETITVSTTALGLTVATFAPSTGANAILATITTSGANLRVLFSGTAATTSLGHIIKADSVFYVCNNVLRTLSMIRDDTTDVEVTVTYSRAPY